MRTTDLTITYTWPEGSTSTSVTLNQAGASSSDGSFSLNVSEITHSSALCTVIPSDNDMLHIAMVVRQDKYSGLTDAQWFDADLSYFESTAAMFGLGLEDYLYQYRIHTGELEFTVTGLDPLVDFYLYAYGIDYSDAYPTLITSISKLPFQTTAPEVVENEIVLEVEIFGGNATIVATPWTNDRLYYVDWLSEKVLTEQGYTQGSVEERIYQWTYDWMSYYMAFGYTIESLGWYGPKSITFSITDPSDTYYAFAYMLNDDATMASDMFLKTITNGTDITSASIRNNLMDSYLVKDVRSDRPARPE